MGGKPWRRVMGKECRLREIRSVLGGRVRWLLPLLLLICPKPSIAETCPSGSQSVGGNCVPNAGLSTQLVAKVGACPSGWHASGNYCVANSGTTKAIEPKVGACPSGWHASGNYCVANSAKSKPIVRKQGACPSGWHVAGAWCQES